MPIRRCVILLMLAAGPVAAAGAAWQTVHADARSFALGASDGGFVVVPDIEGPLRAAAEGPTLPRIDSRDGWWVPVGPATARILPRTRQLEYAGSSSFLPGDGAPKAVAYARGFLWAAVDEGRSILYAARVLPGAIGAWRPALAGIDGIVTGLFETPEGLVLECGPTGPGGTPARLAYEIGPHGELNPYAGAPGAVSGGVRAVYDAGSDRTRLVSPVRRRGAPVREQATYLHRFDLGRDVSIGALHCDLVLPEGAVVAVAVRTARSAERAFSAWTNVLSDEVAIERVCRFVEYRIELRANPERRPVIVRRVALRTGPEVAPSIGGVSGGATEAPAVVAGVPGDVLDKPTETPLSHESRSVTPAFAATDDKADFDDSAPPVEHDARPGTRRRDAEPRAGGGTGARVEQPHAPPRSSARTQDRGEGTGTGAPDKGEEEVSSVSGPPARTARRHEGGDPMPFRPDTHDDEGAPEEVRLAAEEPSGLAVPAALGRDDPQEGRAGRSALAAVPPGPRTGASGFSIVEPGAVPAPAASDPSAVAPGGAPAVDAGAGRALDRPLAGLKVGSGRFRILGPPGAAPGPDLVAFGRWIGGAWPGLLSDMRRTDKSSAPRLASAAAAGPKEPLPTEPRREKQSVARITQNAAVEGSVVAPEQGTGEPAAAAWWKWPLLLPFIALAWIAARRRRGGRTGKERRAALRRIENANFEAAACTMALPEDEDALEEEAPPIPVRVRRADQLPVVQLGPWRALPPIPRAAAGHAMIVRDGVLFCVGRDCGVLTARLSEGPLVEDWRALDVALPPGGPGDSIAAAPGGLVYLPGRGGQGTTPVYVAPFVGNGRIGPFEPVAEIPLGLAHATCTALGHSVFVVGGAHRGRPLDLTFELDRAGRLAQAASLPAGVFHHAAVAAGERVVVAGGIGEDGRPSRGVFSFDGDAWRALAPLPQPRDGAGLASDGTELFLCGGESHTPSAALYRLAPERDRGWRAAGVSLPLPLTDAAVARARGFLVLAGGRSRRGPGAPLADAFALPITSLA